MHKTIDWMYKFVMCIKMLLYGNIVLAGICVHYFVNFNLASTSPKSD